MLAFFIKYKLIIIGIALGAIAGYAYYSFIGCNSGTCAITSRPVNSTLYGAVLGGLLLDMFRKGNK
ncbi:DUF6132 family protein [Bacteroidota bacterium]